MDWVEVVGAALNGFGYLWAAVIVLLFTAAMVGWAWDRIRRRASFGGYMTRLRDEQRARQLADMEARGEFLWKPKSRRN